MLAEVPATCGPKVLPAGWGMPDPVARASEPRIRRKCRRVRSRAGPRCCTCTSHGALDGPNNRSCRGDRGSRLWRAVRAAPVDHDRVPGLLAERGHGRVGPQGARGSWARQGARRKGPEGGLSHVGRSVERDVVEPDGATKGCLTVTSTRVFRDRLCQKKRHSSSFEALKRDEHPPRVGNLKTRYI